MNVVTSDAIGFSLTGAAIDLVIVQDQAVRTNKYTGLQASLDKAALVGITDLTFVASGDVQINQGPVAGRLDWTAVTGAGGDVPGATLTMDETVALSASGNVVLDAFGFVVAKGTFDLTKLSGVSIDDGAAPVATFTADVLTLSTTQVGRAAGRERV